MVVQRTLTPPVGVRSSHPQPHRSSPAAAVFLYGVQRSWQRAWFGTKRPWVRIPSLRPQKALSPSGERAFCFSRSDGIRTARSRHSGTQTVQWTVCEGAGESAPVCRIKVVFFSIFSILCSYGSTGRQLPHKKGWIRHGHFSPASYPAIVSFEQSTPRWLIASIARAVWFVNHIYCTFAHQMYTLSCYRPPDSSSILFIFSCYNFAF